MAGCLINAAARREEQAGLRLRFKDSNGRLIAKGETEKMKTLNFLKVLAIAFVAVATLGCGSSSKDFNFDFYDNAYFSGGSATEDGTTIGLDQGESATLQFDVYDANGVKQTVNFSSLRERGYFLQLSENDSVVTLDDVNGTVTMAQDAADNEYDMIYLFAPDAAEGDPSISAVRVESNALQNV